MYGVLTYRPSLQDQTNMNIVVNSVCFSVYAFTCSCRQGFATSHHWLSTVKRSGWFLSVSLHADLADACRFFCLKDALKILEENEMFILYGWGWWESLLDNKIMMFSSLAHIMPLIVFITDIQLYTPVDLFKLFLSPIKFFFLLLLASVLLWCTKSNLS